MEQSLFELSSVHVLLFLRGPARMLTTFALSALSMCKLPAFPLKSQAPARFSALSKRAQEPQLPNLSLDLFIWHPHIYIQNKFWTFSVYFSHVNLIISPARTQKVGGKVIFLTPTPGSIGK